MNESEIVGVGRRRSRVEADRLALEYERSGMTRQDFCRERGVSVHTLDSYRRRLRGQRPAPGPSLLPVELIESSPYRSRLGAEPGAELGFELGSELGVELGAELGAEPGAELGSRQVPGHDAPLRVELSNGLQIVIEEGFSASLLKRVVATLEA
jgi:hypothetical protein